MFPSWRSVKKPPPEQYFELRIKPDTMELLVALGEDIRAKGKAPKRAGERLMTTLMGARLMNETLIELPWEALHERAEERHSSDAEMLYDWERKA